MKNVEIIVITVSVLAACFFAFLYWCEHVEKKKWREMFHAAEHQTKVYKHLSEQIAGKQRPGVVLPLERQREIGDWVQREGFPVVTQRVVDLENENAGLRSDNETGIRIITEQKNAIVNLTNALGNAKRSYTAALNELNKQKRRK